MNEIQRVLTQHLPPKRKTTPSNWISFNAVCCTHNGQTQDTRGRGGLLLNQGGFSYSCFNCNFKTGWIPGRPLSKKTKSLLKWLGVSDTEIGKLNIEALKIKDGDYASTSYTLNLDLKETTLPENCRPIDDWIASGESCNELVEVIDYIVSERKMGWDWYPWHWANTPGLTDRVIIPFYQNGKIVGYTGRKIRKGTPKYLTDSQPGYVFNIDRQTYDRAYVIVVEGQFDAIALDCVAGMHNELSEAQVARINRLGKEVICVPDRDRSGADLLQTAIDNNWSASLPPWGDDIKDVADAVKKYGRLYVLNTILHYRVHGEIKIKLIKNKLESLDD